ncbi:hypothetical protein OF83DRAFT_1134632 [Amylostereum chailletii]|nr:hypothetical protein OF83DRAFT_1134632 [Amylostereum chailletii]
MSFPLLPAETWDQIIHDFSAADLVKFRGTSRALCRLASPRAFATLLATNTLTSGRNLYNLMKSPNVAAYVKKVIYQHSTEWTSDHAKVRKVLGSAFLLLGELPSLRDVVLHFRPEYVERYHITHEIPSPDLLVQLMILSSMANSSFEASNLPRSLKITGLIARHDHMYRADVFKTLVSRLTSLSFTTLADETRFYAHLPVGEFWCKDVLAIIRPSASTLRSLTIHSNLHVGRHPPLNLDELTLPNLKNLSIGRIHFCTESGAEAFVLRHRDTLTSLGLAYCSIANPRGRLWSHVYDTLARELHRLVKLEVLAPLGAHTYHASTVQGPLVPFGMPTEALIEDHVSLVKFHSVVRDRKSALRQAPT